MLIPPVHMLRDTHSPSEERSDDEHSLMRVLSQWLDCEAIGNGNYQGTLFFKEIANVFTLKARLRGSEEVSLNRVLSRRLEKKPCGRDGERTP